MTESDNALMLRVAREEIKRQAAEIEYLKARLEVSAYHPYDGIVSRDATIKLQDERIAELQADAARYSGLARTDFATEAGEHGLPLTSSGANISGMNNILAIRRRLGLQQSEFADAIGVTQSNVSHYENGRNDPSLDVGRQVVAFAKQLGHCVTLEDVFSEASK